MSIPTVLSLRSLLRWQLSLISGFTLLGLFAVLLIRLFAPASLPDSIPSFLQNLLDERFLFYLAAGFVAQMIDGALGMAYGVSSTSFLMSAGVPPAVASASVHIAEVFTTGASGISHWKFGNVNKDLFKRLALPGAAGAALGAYVLTSFDGNVIKPYVAAYLFIMGAVILAKALWRKILVRELKHLRTLALFGGFVDASGGGGWGPVVTTTLIGTGHHPIKTIGTINAVEFFVALTASGVFSLFVGINSWPVVLGLILGGVLAAPLGAYVCHKIDHKACMILVGLLIILLSARTLLRSLG